MQRYVKERFNKLLNINSNIVGRVETVFSIDRNGKVINVYTLKGVRSDLDSACIKVISIMPKWNKPTFMTDYGERFIQLQFILPITFMSRVSKE